jgi:lipoate-protein ligase A
MAIDNYLAVGETDQGFEYTLRLYRWVRPTLSCGFHQHVEKRVNLEKCRELNVEVVKRPTGGRELMHDGDISFSISGRMDKLKNDDRDIFCKAGQIIAAGLLAVGIDAKLSESQKKNGAVSQGPCLAAISQYEITAEGKKIVPIAQRVFRDSILIHGSIPLRSPRIATPYLLNVEAPDEMQKKIESLATDIGKLIRGKLDLNQMKNGMIDAFQSSFNGECRAIELTQMEINYALQTKNDWKIID